MADTKFCLQCSKKIGMFDKQCKYCGTNQYGENNEFYPDEKAMKQVAKMFGATVISQARPKKQKYQGLTAEEQLITGIHPDDEMYRKTLEMEVLSKNYK